MYVVWANLYSYYPYNVDTYYLKRTITLESYCWTKDNKEATQFASFENAKYWFDVAKQKADYDTLIMFDIVLGIGKV